MITAPGNYYATWWIATDGSEGPEQLAFAIEVNGTGGIIGATPVVTGQLNGSALLTIVNTPAAVTLVNVTGAAVMLATTPVQANMILTEVALP